MHSQLPLGVLVVVELPFALDQPLRFAHFVKPYLYLRILENVVFVLENVKY